MKKLFLLLFVSICIFLLSGKYSYPKDGYWLVANEEEDKIGESDRPDHFPKLSDDWKDAKPIVENGEWHSDMCMIQDKSGRWHCIGISRPMSSMFHAVGDSLISNYQYLPRIGDNDSLDLYMWAPFAIWKDDNTAYLYYSHYKKESQSIRLWVSNDPNLEIWKPYNGTELNGSLVFQEEGSRDACIFYDEKEKCYLMYYASSGPTKVRKSHDLLHWSEPIVVLDTPPMPYKIGESPFVLKKGSWYFLFVSGYDYGRVSVYTSKNPYDFGDADKNRLYEISGHAPEIVQIGNEDYIICAAIHSRIGGKPGESDLNSVYIQKLDWVKWEEAISASLKVKTSSDNNK